MDYLYLFWEPVTCNDLRSAFQPEKFARSGVALEAHHGKTCHLGMGKGVVTKSNLSKANRNRDYHIFEDFAYYMVEQARTKRKTSIFNPGGNVYAFDSTTIDLCLDVFRWTKFRKRKGAT